MRSSPIYHSSRAAHAKPELCVLEPTKTCSSHIKCGPCSKHKYMDIRCKVAVIIGDSCGIGFAAANELLCQEAHRVIIAHKNVENGVKAVEALEAAHGENKACYVRLDFCKPQDFKELFKLAYSKFGGVDILINSVWPLREYRWELDIDANLKSILRGTLLAFEWMPKEKNTMKGGIVINIAATSGLESELLAPVFTATKHGVVGLSKSLGDPVHFKQNGVRVVCLCPAKDNPLDPSELIQPELVKQYSQGLTRHPSGKVGSAVSYLIRYAPSGSVWIVENSALYQAMIPPRKSYSKTVDLL